MPEEELWSLTPREFDALRKRHTAEEERSDYRVALVVCKLHNIHYENKITPDDLLGKKKDTPEHTDAENLAMLQILNAAFGGEVVDQ